MNPSDENKNAVRRWVDEVINGGNLDLVADLYTSEAAPGARAWIAPFRASFPDVHMELIDLVAEGEKVVGRFVCSATHTGQWRGRAPTGQRFENVDEVYFFTFRDGKIADAWGLEDTADRLKQLGLG